MKLNAGESRSGVRDVPSMSWVLKHDVREHRPLARACVAACSRGGRVQGPDRLHAAASSVPSMLTAKGTHRSVPSGKPRRAGPLTAVGPALGDTRASGWRPQPRQGLGADAGASGRVLEPAAGSWESLVVSGPRSSAIVALCCLSRWLVADFGLPSAWRPPSRAPLPRSQSRVAFAPDLVRPS